MEEQPWLRHYPAGVAAEVPPLAADLTTAWQERVERAPDAPAVLYQGRTWTAAHLESDATALGAALQDSGVEPGDRVGVVLQNVPEAVITMLAVWRCGAVVSMINPMYRGQELQHLLLDSGARTLVVDADLVEAVRPVAVDCGVETFLVVGDGHGERTLAEAIQTHRGAPFQPVPRGPEDLAMLSYTSGTTGPPKGAMNTHRNVLTVSHNVAAWKGLGPADRVLCVAPVFHITGAVITLTGPLLAGAAVVLLGRPSPESVAAAFRSEGVTSTTGSITVFNGLARLPDIGPETFPSVRHLFSGGAPVPVSTVRRFRDEFGHYIHNIYGMTETTSACIGVPPGAEAPVDEATGALSIGLPFPGVHCRIVDGEGRELPAGEPGELEISGSSVVPGYWDNAEATEKTFPGGALRTGDGAVMDAEGWVYIVDRLKDQINTSGYKVWPREVEDVLLQHPAVHEAAVVGVPDDYRGEQVVAYVVLKDGQDATPHDLENHTRSQLAAYKAPRRIRFLTELPKTPSGKIRRRVLREGEWTTEETT